MLNNILASQVMSTILSVIVAILILLATITVHEFGHYIVGKIFKFKIKEFAIGMGPAIFKKTKKNGEVFSIRIFPLGGFCAFEGEDEDDETIAKKNEKLKQKNAALSTASKDNELPKSDISGNEQSDQISSGDIYSGDIYGGDFDARQNAAQSSEERQNAEDATGDNIANQNGENSAKSAPEQEVKKLSKDAFNNKKPWQRILVLLAGATFNFIVAVLIVMIYFTAYGHFGFMAYEVKTAQSPTQDSLSLTSGDVITEIDGKFLYFTTDLTSILNGKKAGDLVTITVVDESGNKTTRQVSLRCDVEVNGMDDIYPALDALGIATVLRLETEDNCPLQNGNYVFRFKDNEDNSAATRIYTLDDLYNGLKVLSAGQTISVIVPDGDDEDTENDIVTLTAPLTFDSVDKSDRAAVLAAFGIKDSETLSYQVSTKSVRFGFFEGIGRAVVYSFKTVGVTLQSFWQLLTGRLSLSAVSGPVGTITLTTQYVSLGFKYVLNIASLIGLSVAIFNLLPIPALDGARAVFVIIEWIRKKPVNRNVEAMIHFIGLVALLLFAITVDLIKIF